MATASDLFSGAQDVKRCQLCPGKTRKSTAETVCNTCQVNLCKECVGHHMISDPNLRHDVVTFEFKKSEIIPPLCCIHQEQISDLFCEECDSLLCLKCLASGSHEKHTVLQISKIYSSTKALIKKDLDELEADIAPVYESIVSGIEATSLSIIEKHDERRKTMHDLSKTCHTIIDKVFEKYQRDSIRNERKDTDSIQNLKLDFQKKQSLIRSAIDKNRSILSSNDLSQLVRYTSKNEEFRNIPSRFELTVSSFNPRELTEQGLCQIIGEIPDTKKTLINGEVLKSNQSFVLKSIHTCENTSLSLEVGSKCTDDRFPRAQVACIPDTNQFFVSDNSGIVKHMNSEGKLLKEITTTTRSAPADLTVTREGHLVYIDGDDRSINIVKGDKTECLIREKDWIPGAICCTSTDDFLVQLRSEYRVEMPTKEKLLVFLALLLSRKYN
ncbi:E3 ubiquitin-protein ligase TRIM36-like [Saccostrea cucullata]|uniref:E3 ubiquitin-protein ligase TRIM36-like n=1 Tax=Saccostrea cuccullata TaxID=36930 RepID=UPI002ED0B630